MSPCLLPSRILQKLSPIHPHYQDSDVFLWWILCCLPKIAWTNWNIFFLHICLLCFIEFLLDFKSVVAMCARRKTDRKSQEPSILSPIVMEVCVPNLAILLAFGGDFLKEDNGHQLGVVLAQSLESWQEVMWFGFLQFPCIGREMLFWSDAALRHDHSMVSVRSYGNEWFASKKVSHSYAGKNKQQNNLHISPKFILFGRIKIEWRISGNLHKNYPSNKDINQLLNLHWTTSPFIAFMSIDVSTKD